MYDNTLDAKVDSMNDNLQSEEQKENEELKEKANDIYGVSVGAEINDKI